MNHVASRDGDREGLRTLPVNLLLKGRLCLLVGAGSVALRKVSNLLSHGARVVLVAPDAVPGLHDLAAEGRLEYREGRYDSALLAELKPFLVYAATDDDDANRRIARDAREQGVLATSASSWEEGDFISPSVIPWGRGQVSITTEGASCRQAKFMRLRLQELLGGERTLYAIGVDQRTLSLEEFESVRPDAARILRLTGMLRHLAALEEFVLLSTCNRLELYAWTRPERGLEDAIREILGFAALGDRVFVHQGDDVVTHAVNVVSGHLSEVMCETQITGQFKDAFKRAFSEDVAGVHMQQLHDRVLTLGKRIRSRQEKELDGLPELVAREVSKRLDQAGPRVLVLGAGGLGTQVATALGQVPGVVLTWGNRSLGSFTPEPVCLRLRLDDALQRLASFDQVVSVLGTSRPVIRAEHLERVERAPLFIDLGLPRNVDPKLAGQGAEILDLSCFHHAERHDGERERLLALADTVCLETGAVHG